MSWRSSTDGRDACITEAALRGAVERKLGRNPFTDGEHADVIIEGEETAGGRRELRAQVVQRDRRGNLQGSRTLEAQSCAELLRAATLIVALIIDQHGDGRAAGGAAEPEPPPTPPARIPPATPGNEPDVPRRESPPRRDDQSRRAEPPPPPPTRPRSRTALELALGGGVGTNVGVLPSASTTLLVTTRLTSKSRWSFDWTGAYSLPQDFRRPDVRAHFAVVEQRVRTCFGFVRWSNGTVDGCGGITWGAIIPSTTGVREGNDSWRVIAGPTGGAGLQLGRGDGAVRVDIGATLPFRQYAFSYVGSANTRKDLYSTETVMFFVALSGLGTISP